MTLEDLVRELIHSLGSEGDTILSWEQTREWPTGAVDVFQEAGWINPTDIAETVECPGCQENCSMPVHVFQKPNEELNRAFVACDQRNDIGKVKIPLVRLQQWRFTHGQLANWITAALDLRGKCEKDSESGTYILGTLKGGEQADLVKLGMADPLQLIVNGHSALLSEVVTVRHGKPAIDINAIEAIKPQVSQNILITHPLSKFRAMENLRFDEIKIRIDPENLALRILARGKEAIAPFSSIEITKRNEVTLNAQGKILIEIANGLFNADSSSNRRALTRLSKSLRDAFDTSDSPFRKNVPKFHLSIPRDRLASKRALRRTVGYDDNRQSGEARDAQAFLEENDPHFDPDDPLYSGDPDLDAGN